MSERNPIDIFYEPKSIAIIGAKNRASGFGAKLPRFLLDIGVASERLHLVNPREKEIEGLPVYPTVKDVPVDVDLAIVIVPAPAVPGVLGNCVEKGVKVVNVQSAGFAETGADGAKVQEEMGRLARESGIRIIGPNCVGVVNVPGRFSTCEVDLDAIRPGGISVVAQSGVFGNILMDWAPSQDIALCKMATIGNRADVDETDMLEYLSEDPATRVIVMYLEGVKDGRRFVEVARKASLEKPVLVYKSGETEAGKKATLSHTGSSLRSRCDIRGCLPPDGHHPGPRPPRALRHGPGLRGLPAAEGAKSPRRDGFRLPGRHGGRPARPVRHASCPT